jgi:hypothetical protein
MRFGWRFITGFVSLWALFLSGCGSSGPVPVRGVATLNGQPLPYGQVAFQPTDLNVGRPALARINSDGTFAATTFKDGDGLLPGTYRMAVDAAKPPFDPTANGPAPRLHPRYAAGQTSELTITVSPGDSPHELELKLSPPE